MLVDIVCVSESGDLVFPGVIVVVATASEYDVDMDVFKIVEVSGVFQQLHEVSHSSHTVKFSSNLHCKFQPAEIQSAFLRFTSVLTGPAFGLNCIALVSFVYGSSSPNIGSRGGSDRRVRLATSADFNVKRTADENSGVGRTSVTIIRMKLRKQLIPTVTRETCIHVSFQFLLCGGT